MMPREDADEKSPWDLSQSQGSAASSALNSTTVKLSTASATSLLWSTSLPYMIAGLVYSLAQFLDYFLVIWYCGLGGLLGEATCYPVEAMLSEQLSSALTSSASSFVSRALAGNKVALANRYYSQTLVLGALAGVILLLAFVPWYGTFYELLNGGPDTSGGSIYFVIVLAFAPLLRMFTMAIGQFLAVENRVFLNMMRILVLAVSYAAIELLMYLYFFQGGGGAVKGTGLYFSAIAMVLANLVVLVWMGFIIFKKPILGIPLKGCLKLSWHRAWPPQRKVVGRILLFTLPVYLFNIGQPLTMLICNLLLSSYYSDSQIMLVTKCAMYAYIRYYSIFASFVQAFATGFQSIAGFNLAMGNYTRVLSVLKGSAIWMLVITGVLGLLGFFVMEPLFWALSPPFTEDHYGELAFYGDIYVSKAIPLCQWAGIVPALMSPFYLVYGLANLESRIVLLVLILIIRPLSAAGILVFMAVFVGDGAIFQMAMPFGDLATCVVGFLYYFYYLTKYGHLSKVEQIRIAKKSLEDQIAGIAGVQDDIPQGDSSLYQSQLIPAAP